MNKRLFSAPIMKSNNRFLITPNKVIYKYKSRKIAMQAKRQLEISIPAHGESLARALNNWEIDRAVIELHHIEEKIQKYHDIYFTYSVIR